MTSLLYCQQLVLLAIQQVQWDLFQSASFRLPIVAEQETSHYLDKNYVYSTL
jgi:hypothetical protein